MKTVSTWIYGSLISLSLVGAARAADKKISKSDLPPAVLKTAEEQSKGAQVLGYSSETEDGKLEYEVQLQFEGHSKNVSISSDGRLIEIEEQVDIEKLPASVKTGLLKQAGKSAISKVESLTKGGSIVAYEAQVKTAGKRSEIQVGPQGDHLDHEE